MNLNDKVFIHHGTNNYDNNIAYHNKPLTSENIESAKSTTGMQAYYNKNIQGLWTCIYTPNDKYKSAWDRFASKQKLRSRKELDEFFTFKLKRNARVLIIDSLKDLKKLDSKYVYYYENEAKKELFNKLIEMDIKSEDYIKILEAYYRESYSTILLKANNIATDFDALFITDNAIINMPDALSLWDVETLLIFNTNIIDPYSINNVLNISK